MNTLGTQRTSYSVLAGPPDAPFLAEVVRHHRRVFGNVFTERMLLIDDLPRKAADPGALARLREVGRSLVDEGTVDRVVSLKDFFYGNREAVRAHFGCIPRWNRDFRGIPLAGWVAGLQLSDAEWHLHCDSDILIHQAAGTRWLAKAQEEFDLRSDALVIAPHPGPAGEQAHASQQEPFARDSRGNLVFSSFSSRRFLTRRERFAEILPLKTPWVPSKRIIVRHLLRGKSPLLTWELMVDARQRHCRMTRLHTAGDFGWTLHCPDHGARFVSLLPDIIQAVESGGFPPAQLGAYDLNLHAWAQWLSAGTAEAQSPGWQAPASQSGLAQGSER